jgi:hypothetical protein
MILSLRAYYYCVKFNSFIYRAEFLRSMSLDLHSMKFNNFSESPVPFLYLNQQLKLGCVADSEDYMYNVARSAAPYEM